MDDDWGTDVDGPVAGRTLAWAHVQHKIVVDAAVVSTSGTDVVQSFDGFLASEGITGIPIGVPKTSHTPGGSHLYQATMVTRTAAFRDPSRVYADAVTVYRTVLANAAQPIDIYCTGFSVNLYELLTSPGDGISALTGAQLAASKVRFIFKVGGDYLTGNEYNFNASTQAKVAANYVVANWPTPIIFIGAAVGETVLTGSVLKGTESTDILAQALVDAGYATTGRKSWDSMAVLMGIAGDPVRAGYTTTTGTNSVNASTGANTFTTGAGIQQFVTKAQLDAQYASRINMLLQRANWGTVDPYP